MLRRSISKKDCIEPDFFLRGRTGSGPAHKLDFSGSHAISAIVEDGIPTERNPVPYCSLSPEICDVRVKASVLGSLPGARK